MKAKLGLALLLFVLAATGTSASFAGAVAAEPQKIGIINIELAIIGSNEGQRDFAALAKRFAPKQNEIQAMSTELDDLKKQLNAQGDTMNDDARAKLVKNIEQRQKVLQRTVEDAQNDFQTQQKELGNQIGRKMLAVLDKYGKENGFDAIYDSKMEKENLLWWSAKLGRAPVEGDMTRTVLGGAADITATIVSMYNVTSGIPALEPSSHSRVEKKQVSQVSQLSLVSQPGSVQAYVDEAFKGITSEQEGTLKIENLTPGSHRLRLTLPGYKEWNQNVTLTAGETLPVQAKLEPAGPKPLTEAEIMEALTNGVSSKRTAELVGKFGVDFTLTPEIKTKLRQAGADDKLLLEIATNKK